MMTSTNAGNTNQKAEKEPMRGKPYHDSETAELQKLLKQKITLDNKAKSSLDNLHKREGQYLEDTPNGNILIGFDNYLKAGNSSQRRNRDIDSMRVLSKPYSTIVESAESPASSVATPSHVPTSVNTSLGKGGIDSTVATPTSVNPAARSKRATAKRADDDSEVDVKDTKKARISAAHSRK